MTHRQRKHRMEEAIEPEQERGFWFEQGYSYRYIRALKPFFAWMPPRHFRRSLLSILADAKRYEKEPRDYISIEDAEVQWGRSLRDWALAQWSKHGGKNCQTIKFCILNGNAVFLLFKPFLVRDFGNPKWVNVATLARELNLPYMTIYSRLRYSPCSRKVIQRYSGGYYTCYNRDDIDVEMTTWKVKGRGLNSAPTGRMLKTYHAEDELARARWSQEFKKSL